MTKRLTFLAALLAVGWLTLTSAHADAELPRGWLRSELSKLPAREGLPACCRFDTQCCQRQLAINRDKPREAKTHSAIDVSELPAAVIERGPKGDAALTLYDQYGAPLASLRGLRANSDVRILWPGRAGHMSLGDSDNFINFQRQLLYRDKSMHAWGMGLVYSVGSNIPAKQPFVWRSVSDDDGALRFRSARGEYDREQGTATTQRTLDAPMRDIGQGLVYGFVSHDGGVTTVHVLLPNGVPHFQDAHVVAQPAFGGGMSNDPFTYAELPLTAERGSASIGVRVSRFTMGRWKATGAKPLRSGFGGVVVVSVSQAEGEAQPTLAVALVEEERTLF